MSKRYGVESAQTVAEQAGVLLNYVGLMNHAGLVMTLLFDDGKVAYHLMLEEFAKVKGEKTLFE